MNQNLLIALSLSAVSVACSGGGGDEVADANTVAVDATDLCASSTLTYENFGEQFFSDFCTVCHAADAANRFGAPEGVDWDTLPKVMTGAGRINSRAGSGTSMPPVSAPAAPSVEDRANLSEWILCGTR